MADTPRRWYDYLPHPIVMLLGILVVVAALTYVLPAGTFERVEVGGRLQVVPGTYAELPATPVGVMQLLTALPRGYKAAGSVVYVIIASGLMFGALERTRAIENGVGVLVRRAGAGNRAGVIVGATIFYGLLGVFVGYENNIAMVPVAAVLALAIGGDLILAAGLSVGAMTVGFGASPFNPYTVGIGHQIAGLPLFSGWGLRLAFCVLALAVTAGYNLRYYRRLRADGFAGANLRFRQNALAVGLDTEGLALSQPLESYRLTRTHTLVIGVFVAGLAVMLWGVFTHHWFLDEISGVFVGVAVVVGLVSRTPVGEQVEQALRSVAVVAPGAFMVGLANAVRIVMDDGQISDTITYGLAGALEGLPDVGAAVGMVGVQTIINLLIPSGSGQALATLPVMIPLGDLLGLTRQVTIEAFQLGDGLTNLVNPTMGGLIAMLAMCRVPLDRWLRFVAPLFGVLMALGLVVLVGAVLGGYA